MMQKLNKEHMKRHPKKPTEAQNLKAIKDWLRAKGYLYVRVNNLRLSPKNKQGKRFFVPVDRELLGAPDLLVFERDSDPALCRVYALEVKSHRGRLSPQQVEWAKRASRVGISCHVVRSVDEVEKLLV